MIVKSFSEDMILRELCSDYKEVRKASVKKAHKYLADKRKLGIQVPQNECVFIKMVTSSHNNWRIVIFFGTSTKAPWYASAICMSESEKRTKDYYLLRGLKDKPYFIKFSAHVIKRLYERNEFIIEDLDFLPCFALQVHETVISINFADYKFIKLLNAIDDVDKNEDMSKMFFTYLGTYFGYISQNGNCYLKTYISPKMSVSGVKIVGDTTKVDKEGMYSIMGVVLHQYFNKFLYSEEDLQLLYNYFPKGQEVDLSDAHTTTVLKP